MKINQGGDPLTPQTTNCVLRLLPNAGLALLVVLRDAGVEHGNDVERLKTAYRERAKRHETNALAVHVLLSPVGVDAIPLIRDAVRRFFTLSDGVLFELGASINFAGIRLLYLF